MKFNQEMLKLDLRVKYQLEGKSERQALKDIGISRSTLWRIEVNKNITMSTFLKCVNYIGKPVDRYFTKKK